MERAKKRIAIVGGGITGLTAAYEIKKFIEKEQLPFELILLEGSTRVGGKIHTLQIGTRFFDTGAESIDVRYSGAMTLIKELGLDEQLVYSSGDKPDVYFYNQLHQLTYPTYKGIPIQRTDIWKNKLLTFHGKLASYKDLVVPKTKLEEDLTVSSFLKRRLGEEQVEHVVEPFFSKIYAGDLDEMGVKSSNEFIYDVEQNHRRLSKGLSHYPEFFDGDGNYVTFEKGLEVLPKKLAETIEPHIQYGKKVFEISKGQEGTYVIDINRKEQMRVGAVIVATPATEYSRLFKDEKLTSFFNKTVTASIGFILLSFPKGAIKNEPKGFGFVTPRRNDSHVTSVILLDKKWPTLKQNDEEILIGANFGRRGEESLVSLSNLEIEEYILKDLNQILGIEVPPNYSKIARWPNAIPQYTIHHEERKQRLVAILRADFPGIYIGGNGFGGFGINQCVTQANRISKATIEYMKKQNCI